MTDKQIIKIIDSEIEMKTLALTKQYLEIHDVIYKDGKILIAHFDREAAEDKIIVYLPVKDEEFYFNIYIDIEKEAVTWFDTAPYIRIYFKALSESMSYSELSSLTKLSLTDGWNIGDLSSNGNQKYTWSEIIILPYPEPDEFENKLDKLLTFLEQDPDGIKNLVEKADGYIQVAMNFHNGNSMLGGPHVDKKSIKRMCELNLAIDFDLYAEGNLFN